jgi:DNA helicase IV
MRVRVERAREAGEGEFAQAVLDAWAAGTLESYAEAERGICFGRLDVEMAEAPLYIGRRWVHDKDEEIVVANWQAPASRPFYTATPVDPKRVSRRRRFRLEGRALVGIDDEKLGGSLDDEPGPLGDYLLEELQRSREQHMRDIVATIQADQYRLITYDLEGVLVVQGGPGTGKTAVGLHRASWVLFTYRERLAREGVLVVGPNRTFIEYVSHVLPALGEASVVQRAVGDLRDGQTPERRDSLQVARLKGDVRLAEVLRRAVWSRIGVPGEDLAARLEGGYVRVPAERLAELVATARDEGASYSAARQRLQMQMLRAFYERYGRRLGLAATRSFDEVERALRKGGYLQKLIDRFWPALDAQKLLGQLLTDRARLAGAAEGLLTEEEQAALLRPRRDARAWTESDVPLLDELDALIQGRPEWFGHVIVDEAQDLTPMQVRMIARRAPSGSLTILGDIAQATGPFAYERWEELLEHLPHDGLAVEELVLAYRVPAEIMELALPLLARIAPGVRPPQSYRPGGEEPRFVRVGSDELSHRAAEEALLLDAGEGTVAIIAPESQVPELREVLTRAEIDWHDSPLEELAPAVRLLTAREAKGLEFDHVVVVEPAAIVDEAAGTHGLRHLYVALTRPTQTLTVVHAAALLEPLGQRSPGLPSG